MFIRDLMLVLTIVATANAGPEFATYESLPVQAAEHTTPPIQQIQQTRTPVAQYLVPEYVKPYPVMVQQQRKLYDFHQRLEQVDERFYRILKLVRKRCKKGMKGAPQEGRERRFRQGQDRAPDEAVLDSGELPSSLRDMLLHRSEDRSTSGQ